MSLIDRLRQINRISPPVPRHTKDEKRDKVRGIVSRLSQGNIYLQYGKYFSKEDIEQKRTDMASYDFTAGKYS